MRVSTCGRCAVSALIARAVGAPKRWEPLRTTRWFSSAAYLLSSSSSAPRKWNTHWSGSPASTTRVSGVKNCSRNSAAAGSKLWASSMRINRSFSRHRSSCARPGPSAISCSVVCSSSEAFRLMDWASRLVWRYSSRNCPAPTHIGWSYFSPSAVSSPGPTPRSSARSSRSRSWRAKPTYPSAGLMCSGQAPAPSSACPASSSRTSASCSAPVSNRGASRSLASSMLRSAAKAHECTERTGVRVAAKVLMFASLATSWVFTAVAASLVGVTTMTSSAEPPAARKRTSVSTSRLVLPVPGPPRTVHGAELSMRSSPVTMAPASPSHPWPSSPTRRGGCSTTFAASRAPRRSSGVLGEATAVGC